MSEITVNISLHEFKKLEKSHETLEKITKTEMTEIILRGDDYRGFYVATKDDFTISLLKEIKALQEKILEHERYRNGTTK